MGVFTSSIDKTNIKKSADLNRKIHDELKKIREALSSRGSLS